MFKKIERTATIGHRLMPPPQNPRMILVKILLGCLPKVSYIACTVKLKYSFIKLKYSQINLKWIRQIGRGHRFALILTNGKVGGRYISFKKKKEKNYLILNTISEL